MNCVKHRDGWCLTKHPKQKYKDIIKTACNHEVILPWGIEDRQPTCSECKEIAKARRGKGGKEK